MICGDALLLMHQYLDGDLDNKDAIELKKHLLGCPACNARFKQLEQSEAMVRMLPRSKAPEFLTRNIMDLIPHKKKGPGWLKWIKRHPAVSVASVFLMVMISSFLTLWNEDKDMVVKGSDLEQVVIKGDTVYVPEGHTVDGDLMVKMGKIEVDGAVGGNLVVIDGSYSLASTAQISGQVIQVDQALGWLWYKLNELFSLFSE